MAEIALITGASAGLGLEYAKLFAKDGSDLILVARRKDRLEELAKSLPVKSWVISADLMDPKAPDAIVSEVKKLGLAVDVLVNNAGFGSTGKFWENDGAKERGMCEVNVTALVALTHAFLPGMVERKKGAILNIGSTAGFQPGPYMSTYYATKAFVNHFTEGLAFELRGTGVTATVSCPGATMTEFAQVAGNDKSKLFAMAAMTADVVAAEGYRAMRKGKVMVVHGFKNKMGAMSAGLSPRGLVTKIAASLNSASSQPAK
jgi:uncharacterized protein